MIKQLAKIILFILCVSFGCNSEIVKTKKESGLKKFRNEAYFANRYLKYYNELSYDYFSNDKISYRLIYEEGWRRHSYLLRFDIHEDLSGTIIKKNKDGKVIKLCNFSEKLSSYFLKKINFFWGIKRTCV